MKLVDQLARALVSVSLGAGEAVFWVCHGVRRSTAIAGDVAASLATHRGGILRCPRGHAVPIDGEVYQCQACGFTYAGGSVFLCANPECPSPLTPYTNCPTCGLSVRNPWRYG
jgi:hypothetical protein